jgi:2-iminobutanoate/2-iminopropanoate deaminase
VPEFEAVYKRKLPFAPPRTTVLVSKMENPDIQMEVIAVE